MDTRGFGFLTFDRRAMEKLLPKEVLTNLLAAIDGKEKINPFHADVIASAIKEWATSLGATHFCHWFQPLTGKAAEKHDAFLDIGSGGQVIEKFSGKWLLRGEPDASSFPSGGLRKTSAARGYTCWDVRSAPFIWKTGSVATLCIPAVFFSWCGSALDMKIPLMRSEEKLERAALRLLHCLGVESSRVHATLGCEQEYFLIEEKFIKERPDLLLTGRTLLGAASVKGQELEDHYFATISKQVLEFMKEVEEKAFALGIPLKTRHCEVAPQQYEAAPLFEKADQAVDHNVLLMQLMQQVAKKHGLACLFHEKPFAGLNGSGKHCNWSLQTDTGQNLLDSGLIASHPVLFLAFLVSVLSAIHRHGDLLRASIASAGNDHRLGGHEAPPALISVYLGEELEKWIEAVENQKEHGFIAETLKDLNIPSLPHLMIDSIDRNRTSPFVFTGNKFEFRSVGASMHPAFVITTLNAIVAESLDCFVDQMQKEKGSSLEETALKVIQETLIQTRSIRYLGDNYLENWKSEARARGLPNIEKSLHAFSLLLQEKAHPVFEGILSSEEMKARVAVMEHTYAHILTRESKFMIELFDTQILPACLRHEQEMAKNITVMKEALGSSNKPVKEVLALFHEMLEEAISQRNILCNELSSAMSLEDRPKAFALADLVCPSMKRLRKQVDLLETKVEDSMWPLTKYRKMLFSL